MTTALLIDPDDLARLIREEVRAAVRDEVARLTAPDRLLPAAEAAALLGMTENALRVATSRGRVPCVRRGRSVRWRASDLLKGDA